jgi:outer membrane protein, multidrug efflux system
VPRALASCLLVWTAAAASAAQGISESPRELTLAQAYRLAFAISEAVRIGELQTLQAQVSVDEAWTKMEPQATLLGTGALQNPISSTTTNPTTGETSTAIVQNAEQVTGTAKLSQPILHLDFFSTLEAGHLSVSEAEGNLARARQALMMDVTTAFIGVLRSRQQIEVAQSAVKRAEAQHAAAAARVKAGGALRTAELLAAIDLRRAQVQIADQERQALLQAATFQRLVGIAPPDVLSLPPTPETPPPNQAFQKASDRPDLVALRLKVREALALESAASSRRLWPQLDVQGEYDYSFPKNPLFAPSTYVWFVNGVLTFPLFQSGTEYVEIRRNALLAQISEQNASLLQKQINEQVKDAGIQLEIARREALIAEQQVKEAQENYNLVSTQFRLGGTTFLEVATAQAALTEAENLRLVAAYDRELAAYQLLFAVGSLQL